MSMIEHEAVRKIDRGLYKIGGLIRKAVPGLEEKYRERNYKRHKVEVDGRLEFLDKELAAGEGLVERMKNPEIIAKQKVRIEGIREERTSLISKLPKNVQKRINTEARLDEIGSQEFEGGTEKAVDKQDYIPFAQVEEKRVSADEAQSLGLKALESDKLPLPVSGGAGRPYSSHKLAIDPDYVDYVDSSVVPTLAPRWTSDRRDSLIYEYPEDPTEGKLHRFWRKVTGRDRVGPYLKADSEDAVWHDPDGDVARRELLIKRRGASNAGVAVVGLAALALGAGGMWFLSGGEKSETVVSDAVVQAAVDKSLQKQRPLIVQEVAAATKQAVEEQVAPIAKETAASLKSAVDASIQAALDNEGQINKPLSSNIQTLDLKSSEVTNGDLSHDDILAKELTGRADQSFVSGMADYLIIKGHLTEWGLTGEANPYNGEHKAALERYKSSQNTHQFYLLEREALQNQIILETLQRYPGRGGIFHWENVRGMQVVMVNHKAGDGTPIEPVLPDAQAAKMIMERARTVVQLP